MIRLDPPRSALEGVDGYELQSALLWPARLALVSPALAVGWTLLFWHLAVRRGELADLIGYGALLVYGVITLSTLGAVMALGSLLVQRSRHALGAVALVVNLCIVAAMLGLVI